MKTSMPLVIVVYTKLKSKQTGVMVKIHRKIQT